MSGMQELRTQWVTARALELYHYNVSGVAFLKAFQLALVERGLKDAEPWHPSYAAEIVKAFQGGPRPVMGRLDFRRQLVYLEVVLERYGEQADHDFNLQELCS